MDRKKCDINSDFSELQTRSTEKRKTNSETEAPVFRTANYAILIAAQKVPGQLSRLSDETNDQSE
jgi:hypothetical protein